MPVLKTKLYIGIDPGTKTGLAVYNGSELTIVETMKLHEALLWVHGLLKYQNHKEILVVCENPNTWIPFKGNTDSRAKAQGAGSVKRDFAIWKEFCEAYQIPFRAVRLQGTIKKITAEQFKQITGWMLITSEHGRDAAMLVFKS